MYTHTPSRSLVLKVRDPLLVRELLPDASRIVHLPDGHNAPKMRRSCALESDRMHDAGPADG